MTWPLDVFEAAYADADAFLSRERGKDAKTKMREKAKEMKDRAKFKQQGSAFAGWWVK